MCYALRTLANLLIASPVLPSHDGGTVVRSCRMRERDMKILCSRKISVEEIALGDLYVSRRIILKWISCNESVVD
jgi:hypothetical protein